VIIHVNFLKQMNLGCNQTVSKHANNHLLKKKRFTIMDEQQAIERTEAAAMNWMEAERILMSTCRPTRPGQKMGGF
jgi:hypothetical protein